MIVIKFKTETLAIVANRKTLIYEIERFIYSFVSIKNNTPTITNVPI